VPKRLVMCCDGTWNTADQKCPTNVTKVALAVAPDDGKGVQQRVFYHDGVGSSRSERLTGGAFGFGLSRNVRDTYRFIVENYEPGDELFFLGFSRGAFTARSTAGLVRNSGVLRRENAGRIGEAYALYRSRDPETRPRGTAATLFRRSFSYEPAITFIGVWDTVGAYGIPLNGLRWVNAFNRRWKFHDTALSSTVHAAFQALAIDEQRGPFVPAVWSQVDDAPPSQEVEQTWFAGVHSDVGGGYPETQLSDVTLRWMVERATAHGLVFAPDAFVADPPPGALDRFAVRSDPLGDLHDSRTRFYRLLRPAVRCIGVTERGHEQVSATALERWDDDLRYRSSSAALRAYREREH
jgi:uncharacterized protein (DUF2235 family)